MTVLSGGVHAQYRKPFLKEHAENPLICALPAQIEPARFKQLMTIKPGSVCLEGASNNDRISLVKRLSNSVIPTKPFLDFYNEVYGMIVRGYEKRNPLKPDVIAFHYEVANPEISFEELMHRNLISTNGNETTADHMFLTGHSGMGKTKMKNAVLSGCFPSCIVHQREDFDEIQIVYLSIEMPSNGSLRSLASNIIKAIDETLAPFESTNYSSHIKKANVDDILSNAATLCQNYHVGSLFIDEFQNLHVVSSKEIDKAIQVFSTISNTLGIPVGKIGTNESIQMILPSFKESRRAGDLIQITPYIKSPNGFQGKDWEALFDAAMSHQVVNKTIGKSESLENKLYHLSCGIPFVLFRLWQKVQIEAILSGKETINLGFIDQTYKQHFKLIHTALRALRNNKEGRFKDLINISKLIEDNDSTNALIHLQKMVNHDVFTGAAAAELNQAVDQLEFQSPLDQADKTKLANIKKRLEQNAQRISSGQSIDQKPKGKK